MFGKYKPKIETVKWSWAPAVQSKNVYRDDEFVRSKTKEEALQAIDFLMNRPQGLTYCITVFRDGEYFTYFRHSMPCLGGLVKYKASHGDRYFMNPYFPRDIYVAFPDGDITFIACQRDRSAKLKSPFYEFMFSSESPWVSAFGTKDSIIFKDGYFILTNMDTDPTVFYSLMRLGGFAGGYYSQYSGWNPKAEILASKSGQADPRRLAGQKPIRISGGTWAEGYGYTRPFNESIFKTIVPTRFADFGKHTQGYPQASYKNTYFINTMRNTFGVDLSRGIAANEKNEKALVEAWDYFKAQAELLSDQPGNPASDKQAKFVGATITKKYENLAMDLMTGNHQTQQDSAEY